MTRLSGVAAADGTVVLGGGAGIVVNGSTYCTLGTVGRDAPSRFAAPVASQAR
jgi:hypothetical protein